MNRLRVLVVDDEPLIRSGIRRGLAPLKEVEVTGEAESVADAVLSIVSLRPDLVLLDIQLPDGTAFDVVNRIGVERMPAVIFVTAYDEYAVRAFEINAVDYLLKPFDDDRLRASIARARGRFRAGDHHSLSRELQALLEARERRWPERLVVRNGDRFDFIAVDSVDWVESANNYVHLHCGQRRYLLAETLTSLENRLDPAQFVRVHRCHLVNTSRILSAQALISGVYELELRDGTRLRTGRQYRGVIQTLVHG